VQNHDNAIAVGGELYFDRVHSARVVQNVVSGDRSSTQARFPDRSLATQLALYTHVSQHVSDRNMVSGGLRATSVAVHLPASPHATAQSVDVHDISADLGWIFKITDVWQLVANIGEGFRAPNIFDVGSLGERPGNRFNIPNPELGSERVTHTDVGVRHRSDAADIDLTLFHLRYRNKITSVLTGSVTTDGRDIVQSRNADRVVIHGIEASASFRLNQSLVAHALLNYTHGIQQISGSAREAADRIPPLNASVELNYQNGRHIGLDAWFHFASRQDRLSARDTRDVRIDPDGTPAWGVLGARIRFTPGEAWQLALGIDNVTDKRYRRHGSGIDEVGRNFSFSIHRSW